MTNFVSLKKKHIFLDAMGVQNRINLSKLEFFEAYKLKIRNFFYCVPTNITLINKVFLFITII